METENDNFRPGLDSYAVHNLPNQINRISAFLYEKKGKWKDIKGKGKGRRKQGETAGRREGLFLFGGRFLQYFPKEGLLMLLLR